LPHLARFGEIYLGTDPLPMMAQKLLTLRQEAPDELGELIDMLVVCQAVPPCFDCMYLVPWYAG